MLSPGMAQLGFHFHNLPCLGSWQVVLAFDRQLTPIGQESWLPLSNLFVGLLARRQESEAAKTVKEDTGKW